MTTANAPYFRRSLQGGDVDERMRALLDFERQCSLRRIPKARAIRERFGVSAARYHQMLNRTLDMEQALMYDPMLVHRLRRLRELRRAARLATRLGLSPSPR